MHKKQWINLSFKAAMCHSCLRWTSNVLIQQLKHFVFCLSPSYLLFATSVLNMRKQTKEQMDAVNQKLTFEIRIHNVNSNTFTIQIEVEISIEFRIFDTQLLYAKMTKEKKKKNNRKKRKIIVRDSNGSNDWLTDGVTVSW